MQVIRQHPLLAFRHLIDILSGTTRDNKSRVSPASQLKKLRPIPTSRASFCSPNFEESLVSKARQFINAIIYLNVCVFTRTPASS